MHLVNTNFINYYGNHLDRYHIIISNNNNIDITDVECQFGSFILDYNISNDSLCIDTQKYLLIDKNNNTIWFNYIITYNLSRE